MKKIKTKSQFTFIMENLDGKFVRKYKKKETKPYPQTVPENKMLKLLNYSNIKCPKILKKHFTSIDIEFIEGRDFYNQDKTLLINIVANYIFDLKNINPEPIKKYIKWNNNTEFFYMHLNKLLDFIKKIKTKNKEKLSMMGIDESILNQFININLYDMRKMTIIHSDIQKDNIINKNTDYFLIDWDQSTYGDIAYEFAIHFVREKYTPTEMNILLERMCTSLQIEPSNLMNDINTYMQFENIRATIYYLNKACELKNNKQDFTEELDIGYEYYLKLNIGKLKDDIRNIINM